MRNFASYYALITSKMQKCLHILLCFGVAWLLASCVTTRRINYLQEPGKNGIPEYADTLEYADYLLQRGDYLYINVFSPNAEEVAMYNGYNNQNNNNQLQNTSDAATSRLYLYLVGEDGTINFPYIGKIPALGKTVRDVKFLLEDALKESVSALSVGVKLSNRSFSVLGEAGSGRYSIPKEKLNIFQALAMCGDMSTYSKRNEIQIIRQTENGTIIKTFDLRSKSIINSEFYYIQPNDVIYVPFYNAKFFGVTNFTGVLSLTMSTISFGTFMYGLGVMIYNAVHTDDSTTGQ